MRKIIVLLMLLMLYPGSTLAQDNQDCLEFTDALLKAGDTVQQNTPAPGDESGTLLEKYTALIDVRLTLTDALKGTIPCHEEPTLDLLDATLNYQDYITLRLGQKLNKTFPDIASLLDSTLEAANSYYSSYDVFWNPPDA